MVEVMVVAMGLIYGRLFHVDTANYTRYFTLRVIVSGRRFWASLPKDDASGRSVLILASHSLALVKEWCDRAILLDHGRVVAMAASTNVAAAYESGGA